MQRGFASPVIILLIVLPLVGFFLGTQYKQTGKLPSVQNGNNECSKQLAEKEEEVKLCVQDSASVGDPSKSAYTFKDFGIYFPSFEGKLY